MELSENQINELRLHWPLEGNILFHRHVENFVYFARLQGREVVLRLTEVTHRQQVEIESELDWMEYLRDHGMKIAAPVRAQSGERVVQLPGETVLFAVVFEKAPGAWLKGESTSDEFIEKWGNYLGKMHRLTKSYTPSQGVHRRQDWMESESLRVALRGVDLSDVAPAQKLFELTEWMKSLPRNEHTYGLIHTDLHRGNFFVADGEITSFDFDDAVYHWFGYDFVAPLNSMNSALEFRPFGAEKQRLLDVFLRGYSKENALDQIWVDRIPLFEQHRVALIYHWTKTKLAENKFNANAIEWVKMNQPRFLETLQQSLKLL